MDHENHVFRLMSDKEDKSGGSNVDDNLPFFRRFMKKYVLPERKLFIGSANADGDELRQVSQSISQRIYFTLSFTDILILIFIDFNLSFAIFVFSFDD